MFDTVFFITLMLFVSKLFHESLVNLAFVWNANIDG